MTQSFDLNALQDKAAALVDAATRAGADAADAVVAASRSTSVDVREGKVEESQGSENHAFSLRAFVGDRSASVSANLNGDPQTLAQRVVAMAKVSPEDEYGGLADADNLAKELADLDLFDDHNLNVEELGHLANECEVAALAVPGVAKSSGASAGFSLGGSVLSTSSGFVGSYQSSRFSISVSAIAGDGVDMERDYDFDGQRHFGDLRNPADIGKVAGERAAKRVNPRQVETQSAPVVFEPRMARTLLGHLAGAINGSSIARNTSFLKDDLGAKIFKSGVSVVDEPSILRGGASRPFDGEGVTTQDLALVEDGVLNAWLLDSRTARQLGLKTNGRANRSGSNTVPGTTNLTLQKGSVSRADMIGNIKNGFYVTELIGQGVNLISGDYSRGASGFWIENGELTFAVSEVTIAGNLREMFAQMTAADDLERRQVTNTPTVMIEGMTIAGR